MVKSNNTPHDQNQAKYLKKKRKRFKQRSASHEPYNWEHDWPCRAHNWFWLTDTLKSDILAMNLTFLTVQCSQIFTTTSVAIRCLHIGCKVCWHTQPQKLTFNISYFFFHCNFRYCSQFLLQRKERGKSPVMQHQDYIFKLYWIQLEASIYSFMFWFH